jgi:hypothetical protein
MTTAASTLKRRIAHSATEKRRRIKTNLVFTELKAILPNCVDKDIPKLGIILNNNCQKSWKSALKY